MEFKNGTWEDIERYISSIVHEDVKLIENKRGLIQELCKSCHCSFKGRKYIYDYIIRPQEIKVCNGHYYHKLFFEQICKIDRKVTIPNKLAEEIFNMLVSYRKNKEDFFNYIIEQGSDVSGDEIEYYEGTIKYVEEKYNELRKYMEE